MYLHLGGDVVVRSSDIIGIFDIENTSVSKLTKEYLGEQEKRHRVITVSPELPKSLQNKGCSRFFLKSAKSRWLSEKTDFFKKYILEEKNP